jgi:hypothetical protein
MAPLRSGEQEQAQGKELPTWVRAVMLLPDLISWSKQTLQDSKGLLLGTVFGHHYNLIILRLRRTADNCMKSSIVINSTV